MQHSVDPERTVPPPGVGESVSTTSSLLAVRVVHNLPDRPLPRSENPVTSALQGTHEADR